MVPGTSSGSSGRSRTAELTTNAGRSAVVATKASSKTDRAPTEAPQTRVQSAQLAVNAATISSTVEGPSAAVCASY